jgi:hypothetical protein
MLAGTTDWRVSVTTLASYLDITERRVQQLAAEGEIPESEGGQYLLLGSTKGYVAYLQKAAQGKAVSDDGKEKQRVQVNLLQLQRDDKQTDLDVKRKAFVPDGDHRAVIVKLIKVLTEGSDSLPDLLERKTGVTGAVIEAVSEVCLSWRQRVYELTMVALGGEVIPDAPLQKENKKIPALDALLPDAEPSTKRKRGRPRKVNTDSFTPQLID